MGGERAEDVLFDIAYDESVRALAEQTSLIDSFHTRAGLLLSAGAITTSVLGSRALDHGSVGFASCSALAAFFALALLSMTILWPRQQEFAADVARIIGNHIVSGDTGSVIDLQFGIACGLLLVEVLSWITAIVTSV